jgi:hypothetical protein
MIQEEQNYKKLYSELKKLRSHVKLDSKMQGVLLKSDYSDDEAVGPILESLEALKISMNP